MGTCIEFQFVAAAERHIVSGRMTPWKVLDEVSVFFPDNASEALDRILEPYDSSELSLSITLDNSWGRLDCLPWALIVFDREYRLAGHLTCVRPDAKSMPFMPHARDQDASSDAFVPGVGVVFVLKQDALEQAAATGTPMLQDAWLTLKDMPDDQCWLCLPDPLPEDWVKQISEKDDERYLQYQ